MVVGADRHGSMDRAARLLGFGRADLVVVATDEAGRMLPAALARRAAGGAGPSIVCLQAGEVHTGAFDPFPALLEVSRRHDTWVHVDGAFGLWAGAAGSTRHLTAGAAGADSWATDAHKTLNVPYDSGLAIVRDRSHLVAAFGVRADTWSAGRRTPRSACPSCRGGRGASPSGPSCAVGRDGVEELVDRLARHARRFADGAARIPGLRVVNDVDFTQVLVAAADDRQTSALGARILAEGTAVLTPGRWREHAVLRCSVSGWATTDDDIDRTVAVVGRLAADTAARHRPA